MKTWTHIAFAFLLISTSQLSAQDTRPERSSVLLRCDDWGMSHAVNMAARKVLETGFPVSASVMFACPWYQEAVEILKGPTNVSVGVHLTLNAEWKNYRWGPVAGASNVPSLVDSLGYFFPTRALLFGNKPSLVEIERELRAQVKRAVASGLRIDYVDYHMGAAVQTPETRAIVEKIAAEYKLGISRYFGEKDVRGTFYSAPPEWKLDTLLAAAQSLPAGGIHLFVFHVGIDTPELSALQDFNEFGPKEMSRHRQAELNALLSPEFQKLIHKPEFRLVSYRQLIEEIGLNSMKRPAE